MMDIVWKLYPKDAERLRAFVEGQLDNAYVRRRIRHNVENPPLSVSLDRFWEELVGCLLTSQQRSGPNSPVARLIRAEPFPLSYGYLRTQPDPKLAAQRVLREFGGIRFTTRIPEQLGENHRALEAGRWAATERVLQRLIGADSAAEERAAAEFVQCFAGIGPKQSRNLLQGLGLTRYEIPIDSRITRWLNKFGFPLTLSAAALGDAHYYNFVSDGIQALGRAGGILPCVLDAAIFSSYDGDAWTDDNVV